MSQKFSVNSTHPLWGVYEANHEVKIVTVNRFGLITEDEAIFCECDCQTETNQKGKCVCSSGSMHCVEGLFEKTVNSFKKEDFIPDVIYVNGYMLFEIACKLTRCATWIAKTDLGVKSTNLPYTSLLLYN